MDFDDDDMPELVKPAIVGVTGLKGSGKDTIAAFLVKQYGFRRIAFADKLKDVCADVFGFSQKQLHGSITDKETIDPRWGVSPRHVLQTVGTEGFRAAHPEVWCRYVLRQIEESDHLCWVIPDVRFVEEVAGIRALGGVVWKVFRPGVSTGVAETHSSETEIAKLLTDLTLKNDLSIRALEAQVTMLMENPNNPVYRVRR